MLRTLSTTTVFALLSHLALADPPLTTMDLEAEPAGLDQERPPIEVQEEEGHEVHVQDGPEEEQDGPAIGPDGTAAAAPVATPESTPAPYPSTLRRFDLHAGAAPLTALSASDPDAVSSVIFVLDVGASLQVPTSSTSTIAVRVDHLHVAPHTDRRTGEAIPYLSVRLIPIEVRWRNNGQIDPSQFGLSGGMRFFDTLIRRDLRSYIETQMEGRLLGGFVTGSGRIDRLVRMSVELGASVIGASYQAMRSNVGESFPGAPESTRYHGTVGMFGGSGQFDFRIDIGETDSEGRPQDGFHFAGVLSAFASGYLGAYETPASCVICFSDTDIDSVGIARLSAEAGVDLMWQEGPFRAGLYGRISADRFYGHLMDTQSGVDLTIGALFEWSVK